MKSIQAINFIKNNSEELVYTEDDFQQIIAYCQASIGEKKTIKKVVKKATPKKDAGMFDLNKDGKVDSKDVSFAAKALRTLTKGKKKKK